MKDMPILAATITLIIIT